MMKLKGGSAIEEKYRPSIAKNEDITYYLDLPDHSEATNLEIDKLLQIL